MSELKLTVDNGNGIEEGGSASIELETPDKTTSSGSST
jgi:hypothetical protein